MRFRLYREYGALNSKPVFDAFEAGVLSLGHSISTDSDIDVIWSVLWKGRMLGNKDIYYRNLASGKPTIIIEVGNFNRGITWRIGLNHINNLGIFGNTINLDTERPAKLGGLLPASATLRNNAILIALQHQFSEQWAGMPDPKTWTYNIIEEIRQYSDRPIIIRPHPRSPISFSIPGTTISYPTKVPGTYDDFNMQYNYHCIINHNSGPGVQASMRGIPVICDTSSLAFPVSIPIALIEEPVTIPINDWLIKLAHTEWTTSEMSTGIPLHRILSTL